MKILLNNDSKQLDVQSLIKFLTYTFYNFFCISGK